MKMTYAEILNNNAVLIKVGEKVLPRKAAHAVTRNIRSLEKEVKFFWEQYNDIAKRYAAQDKDGEFILDEKKENYTFASKENEASFHLEAKELRETEVDIDIMKFKAEELDKCDTCDRYDILSPLEEAAIDWMIDYGEDPEPAS